MAGGRIEYGARPQDPSARNREQAPGRPSGGIPACMKPGPDGTLSLRDQARQISLSASGPQEAWQLLRDWASKQPDPAAAMHPALFQVMRHSGGPGFGTILPDVVREASRLRDSMPPQARENLGRMLGEACAARSVAFNLPSLSVIAPPLAHSIQPRPGSQPSALIFPAPAVQSQPAEAVQIRPATIPFLNLPEFVVARDAVFRLSEKLHGRLAALGRAAGRESSHSQEFRQPDLGSEAVGAKSPAPAFPQQAPVPGVRAAEMPAHVELPVRSLPSVPQFRPPSPPAAAAVPFQPALQAVSPLRAARPSIPPQRLRKEAPIIPCPAPQQRKRASRPQPAASTPSVARLPARMKAPARPHAAKPAQPPHPAAKQAQPAAKKLPALSGMKKSAPAKRDKGRPGGCDGRMARLRPSSVQSAPAARRENIPRHAVAAKADAAKKKVPAVRAEIRKAQESRKKEAKKDENKNKEKRERKKQMAVVLELLLNAKKRMPARGAVPGKRFSPSRSLWARA